MGGFLSISCPEGGVRKVWQRRGGASFPTSMATRGVSFVVMGKREMLRWIFVGAAGAIVAGYATRGIDWLDAQLPILVAALAAVIEWFAARSWDLLHRSLPVAGGLTVLFLVIAIRQRVDVAIRRLSRRVIEWAARSLPRRLRDRWRDEWLAELDAISAARPISGFGYAVGVARSSRRVESFS